MTVCVQHQYTTKQDAIAKNNWLYMSKKNSNKNFKQIRANNPQITCHSSHFGSFVELELFPIEDFFNEITKYLMFAFEL